MRQRTSRRFGKVVVGDLQVVLGSDWLQVAVPLSDDGGLNAGAGVGRLGGSSPYPRPGLQPDCPV
ncbi:MAG: hypothetical protein CMJ70_20925 [Planctomycetaceae bacterium]|nr:hypothetical protein [Planctomycetaceae bacterium]